MKKVTEKKTEKSSGAKTRVITGIFILLVTVPLVLFSEYITYSIALGILSVIATFEILRVLGVHKQRRIAIPAYILAAALPFASYFISTESAYVYLLAIFALVFAYLMYLMGVAIFSKGVISVSKISEIFFTLTYVIVSFSSLSMLRYIDKSVGLYWLILVFIAAWMTDTCAYFVGSLIGKHKLIPEISPKKTVEGSVGGVVGTTLVFILFGFILDLVIAEMTVNYLVLGIYAVILAVVSQLGDLIASLIKREHGVKDYSDILPGHGGIMDRFDSILSVSTVLLILTMIVPPFVIG